MNNVLKRVLFLSLSLIFCFTLISCGKSNDNNENNIAEKIELTTSILKDIQFENDENTKIKKDGNTYNVSGTIIAMSQSQKTAFGVDDVTHVVSLKFTFDKKKTVSTFEIKGNTTKAYSVDKNTKNYVGSITDLLDNEDNEDAYCHLILAANTKSYTFTIKYSDKTTSTVKLNINVTLATSTED